VKDGVATAAMMGPPGQGSGSRNHAGAINDRNALCESEPRVARLNAIFLRWMVVFGALVYLALSSVAAATEHRSREVMRDFQREHPCPSTGKTSGARPGYRKDHTKPLACDGPDAVWNLQWQTVRAAAIKDRWERPFAVADLVGSVHHLLIVTQLL